MRPGYEPEDGYQMWTGPRPAAGHKSCARPGSEFPAGWRKPTGSVGAGTVREAVHVRLE
ncbi:hypothetical protein SAMN05421678_107197 [Actinopolymorpha cephalotaxi]|uniref:Uncharacterized protein n=1 Tax=Actinopolymorpha cephalotaxi TaxID=504797 RepID=A0A1I2THE5_9ACTN|nr:hypothetical protein [Actinopolymorpha cephalotaxi]SFG64340.1 hypothetical protein SAMN05421678_107197 [Actinopolymorpha cephalotaxi]